MSQTNKQKEITLLKQEQKLFEWKRKLEIKKSELNIKFKKVIDTHILNKQTYHQKKRLIKQYLLNLYKYNHSLASFYRFELFHKKTQLSDNILPPYKLNSIQLNEFIEWFEQKWLDKKKIACSRVIVDKINRSIKKSYILFTKIKFIKHILLKNTKNVFRNKLLLIRQKRLEHRHQFYSALSSEINSRFYGKYLAKHVKALDHIKNKEVLSEDHGVIYLKNVSKYYFNKYNAFRVLNNISLNIKYGEFVVIVGPSGSGKTTLLNIISGLDRATTGTVIIADENLSDESNAKLTQFRRRKIGYVFQQYALLPNLTVRENVEIGQYLQKDKSKWIDIDKLLQQLDIFEQRNKFPHELSGGQQQRVSIARSIAKAPMIIFGDEPTGAVDEAAAKNILDMFIKINKQYKTTIVIVTHNNELTKLATTVINVRDGHIIKTTNKI